MAYKKSGPPEWVLAARPLLGTMRDPELARMLGVNKGTLRALRLREGVAMDPNLPKVIRKKPDAEATAHAEEKHPGILEKVGVVSDTDIAREYGISRAQVRNIRNRTSKQSPAANVFFPNRLDLPQSEVDRIGKEPDAKLAKEWGVSASSVCRWRKLNRIETFENNDAWLKIAAAHDRVGQVSDLKLSLELQVSPHTIMKYRKKHNIKPVRASPASEHFVIVDKDELKRLIDEGKSIKEIATHFNRSPACIHAHKKSLGLTRKKP
jgi:DNA-binding CsgD family transcriptional regulator